MFAALLGLLSGYVGSIPAAGPLALLIVAAGLEARWRRAAALAVGGALAESGYALVAYSGAAVLVARIEAARPVLDAAAPVLALGVGAALLLDRPSEGAAKIDEGHSGAFAAGFSLVALNPAFLAFWLTIASSLDSLGALSRDSISSAAFTAGAFVGITAWFGTLLAIVRSTRRRLTAGTLTKARRGLGLVLVGTGVFLAARLL